MRLLSSLLGAFALSAVSARPEHHNDAKLGAVASEAATCSKIGIEILKQGGNAADAVSLPSSPIASQLTISSSSQPNSASV
jgi:gamma-glutamyltranspeptidase